MKLLIITLLSFVIHGQPAVKPDSIDVRVFNKGRFYIKSYVLTLDNKKYTFKDIPKGHYSNYQSLPYLWTSNPVDATIVRRRFLQYDEWSQIYFIPIDKIGEKKLAASRVTINLKTKRKSGKVLLETEYE